MWLGFDIAISIQRAQLRNECDAIKGHPFLDRKDAFGYEAVR